MISSETTPLKQLLCLHTITISASLHNNHFRPTAFLAPHRRLSRHPNKRLVRPIFSNRKDDDLQNIYEQVQQEDSDWFNSLSELLGDEFAADAVTLINEEIGDRNSHPLEPQETGESTQQHSDEIESSSEQNIQLTRNNKDQEKSTVTSRELPENKNVPIADKPSANKQTPPSTTISIRLHNKQTSQTSTLAPLIFFTSKGYSINELTSLRPRVLELIVEDGIPKPRKGIPDKWIRDRYEDLDDEDVDWIVEVYDEDEDVGSGDGEQLSDSGEDVADELKSSKTSDVVSESWGPFSSSRVVMDDQEVGDEKENNVIKEVATAKSYSTEQSNRQYNEPAQKSPKRQAQSKQNEIDNDYDSVPRRRQRISSYNEYNQDSQPRQRRRNSQQQRRQYPKRRELIIDTDNNDPPPNKFWMDLPTFRDFLRTEARMRLSILGPDWKETVLDESRWRFDLYKRWLYLLNDGVGENPLYTYGERPRRRRGYNDSGRRERRRRGRSLYNESEVNGARNDDGVKRRRDQRRDIDDSRGAPRRASVAREGGRSVESTRDGSMPDLSKTRQRSNHEEETLDQRSEQKQTAQDNERILANTIDTEDNEMLNDEREQRQRPREASERQREHKRPRRRQKPSDRQFSTQRISPKWKDFGDLEEQLLNGGHEDYSDAMDSPQRRVRD